MTPETFELTRQELDSALWKKLEKHFGKRLSLARRMNDGDLDERSTQLQRGRIKAYKEILGLNPDAKTADREASGD